MNEMLSQQKRANRRKLDGGIPADRRLNTTNVRDSKNNWYVIQVPTGKEAVLCETVQRVAGRDVALECFSPTFATEKKVRGEWIADESLLLPGYIIVATDDPQTLYERLRSVDEFTRLLRSCGGGLLHAGRRRPRVAGGVHQRGRPHDSHEHGRDGGRPRGGVPRSAQRARGLHQEHQPQEEPGIYRTRDVRTTHRDSRWPRDCEETQVSGGNENTMTVECSAGNGYSRAHGPDRTRGLGMGS